MNTFDVSKLVTAIKAKNETGVTETRLITSERDIEVQMEIGLYSYTNTTEGTQLGFMKNQYDEHGDPTKIYTRMPDNMIDFLNAYFMKYNRYPNVNANINLYDKKTDEQGEVTYNITDTIQGPIVARYKAARKPMEEMNGKITHAVKNPEEKKASISMTSSFVYVKDPDSTTRKDCTITASKITATINGETQPITGMLVLTPVKDSESTETVVYKTSYDCQYPDTNGDYDGRYMWGILDESQQETNPPQYKDWVKSTHCFGSVIFTMGQAEEHGEYTHLEKIDFDNIPAFEDFDMELNIFSGHTEEDNRYMYAIDGFLEEKYDRNIIQNISTVSTYETAKNIRFKFALEVQKETAPPQLTFEIRASLFDEKTILNGNGWYGYKQGDIFMDNVRQDKKSGLSETYMYLDESLHLPDIHMTTSEEIPFSLRPMDYYTVQK